MDASTNWELIKKSMYLAIGRIVHIEISGLESTKICNAAIIGGQVDTHFWVEIFKFGASNEQAWLTDLSWHNPMECPNQQTSI